MSLTNLLIKEFNTASSSYISEINDIYNQVLRDLENVQKISDIHVRNTELFHISPKVSPILDELKLTIFIGEDWANTDGGFLKNKRLTRDTKYFSDYLLYLNTTGVDGLYYFNKKKTTWDNRWEGIHLHKPTLAVGDLKKVMKDMKPMFTHEMIHYFDLVGDKTGIGIGDTKKSNTLKGYVQSDHEWSAYMKSLLSDVVDVYQDKVKDNDVNKRKALSPNFNEFIDFWTEHSRVMSGLWRIKDELDIKYKNKFNKKLYALQQYLIKNSQ